MPADAKEVQVVLTFKDDGSYDLKKIVKEINDTLNQAGVSAKVAGDGFSKMGKQVKEADAGLTKLKGSFRSGMLQMAAGLGIWTGMSQAISFFTRTIRDTIEQGKRFEEAFSKVRVATKGTAEQNEALRQSIMRMNPALGSATDLTLALATAVREFSEYSRPEQLKFVETAGRVAVAGFTDVNTAVEALSTVVKGYRMELGDAARAGEVMVRATQIEGVAFEQVARGLTKLGATAKSVGVSFSELIGAYLTLQERQDPQLAMMQLRMLLTNLMKPSVTATRNAKQLGVEWSAAGVKAKGFVEWLKQLNIATAGSAEVLDNLVPGGRQMIGMLELVGNNAKETAGKVKELQKAWDEGGVVAGAWQERLHSMSFLLDTAKEMFNRFKIAIFQGFSAPLLEGINSQKDFEKRMEELNVRVVEFGTKVGKAIYGFIETLVKLASTIKMVAIVWASFWAANKVAAIGNAIINAINMSSNAMAGMKLATMGVVGAMQKLLIAVAVFKAGWTIGRWLSDVTGLTKAVLKVNYGVTPEMAKETENMMKLKEALRGTGLSAIKLRQEYGSYGKALDAVTKGENAAVKAAQESAVAQREKDAVTKASITYQEGLRSAMEGTLDTTEEGQAALEGLTEAQKNQIISTNHAREEMKKYGFTFKTELIERYNALKLGMQLFRKEMTADDYEKFRKVLKGLAGDLGYVSKSLEQINVLTKEEVDIEMKKQLKIYADLEKALKDNVVSMDQYKIGIQAVDAALKRLDPTLTATWMGLTKLATTPLPAARTLPAGLQAPGVTEGLEPGGPMMTAEEVKKALASLGPSIQYLTYLEGLIGAPLKELAKSQLPEFVKNFKSAMLVGGFSAEGLKQAADALIQHYKDAGEKVPPELARMGSAVTSTWQGVAQTMTEYWGNAMAEMIKSGLNFRDVINMTWQTLAVGAGKAIGNMAEHALSSLGAMAGPVGSLVGSLAGSLIGAVGKLFGIKSKAEKEAEKAKKAEAELKRQVEATQKAYSSFGKISEATAKKIVEMRKETNSATAAIMTLNDVMNDAGITMANLSGYVKKMEQALRDMARGLVPVTDGIQAIGQSFNSLMEWSKRFGQEGSKTLTDFIKKVRELGISIQEIDDYVYSQLGQAVSGLQAMTDAFGGQGYADLIAYKDEMTKLAEEVADLSTSRLDTREAQTDYIRKKNQLEQMVAQYEDMKDVLADALAPELERIGNLTVTTFNAVLEQSGSMTEAFAAISGPLTALKERYEELGLTGGAAIQELMKLADVEEANRGLFEAIEGNRQVLNALGNTGFLTAEAMKDTADQAQSYYDQLLGQGLTANQALAMLSPTLADLEFYAKQNPQLQLDDATKALIEQAKAAGVFRERGRDISDILEDAFPDIIERLDRLIDQGDERRDRDEGRTRAQSGFYGTVTGPRDFYVEPGVTETVHIGKPGTVGGGTTIIEKKITLEPVVIPFKDLQAFVIEWVQKAGADERILFRPRAVRGGKG